MHGRSERCFLAYAGVWQPWYEAFTCLRRDVILINVHAKEPHPVEWTTQNKADWDGCLYGRYRGYGLPEGDA